LKPENIIRTDTGNHKVILSHGYCAMSNPWELAATQRNFNWTEYVYLEELGQSITNDQFALELIALAEANNLESFGIIAHSQGGLASVQLHNFYWSGLENTQGGRLIQSVGSPYKGSTGAGSAADLAAIFGISCGSNFDLTHDGAALWLAGISPESAKDVYYYVTQYDPNDGIIHYCSLVTNLVLEWPNDGLSEVAYTDLPGANFMGLTKGECHTLNMRYDPQYYNTIRNTFMNENAAR